MYSKHGELVYLNDMEIFVYYKLQLRWLMTFVFTFFIDFPLIPSKL